MLLTHLVDRSTRSPLEKVITAGAKSEESSEVTSISDRLNAKENVFDKNVYLKFFFLVTGFLHHDLKARADRNGRLDRVKQQEGGSC